MGMQHVSAGSFQAWRTPRRIIQTLVEEYDLILDAAADKDNTCLPVFYDGSEGSDGLKQPWTAPDAGAWCNPPYAEPEKWVIKALEAVHVRGDCARAVLLLPAAVGTGWFTRALLNAEVHLFNNRIRFDAPPYDQLDTFWREKLYKMTATGPSPKRSPGGGNALVIVEGVHERPLGVTALRSAESGEVLRRFTDGWRVD